MKKSILLTSLASLVMSQGHAMVVHEWGTFTSLQGSNGKDQIGIYHDDEKLPSFVHDFGEVFQPTPPPAHQPPGSMIPDEPCHFKGIPCADLRSNGITQRMETPVIYFYHSGGSSQSVTVNVDFPEGVISETYPAPVEAFPQAGSSDLKNGHVKFDLDVLPMKAPDGVPFVDPTNIYSYARNVSSNTVQVGHGSRAEQERFVFYRGVGHFDGSLKLNVSQNSLRLENVNPITDSPIREMILIHTDELGRSAFQVMFAQGQTKNFPTGATTALDLGVLHAARASSDELNTALFSALERSGLYKDEAQAMVDTWGRGYFRTPGFRILYILAPETLKRILPMDVRPQPQELARTMVGRLEIVTPAEEAQIFAAVRDQKETFDVQSLGRFAEAKLRAVRSFIEQVPTNPEYLQLIDTLIARAENL